MAELRDATREDMPQVLAINEAAVPAVNSLTLERLLELVDLAATCRVAVLDGEVVGFMLLIGTGAAYDSTNYRYFRAQYPNLLYIDRIALSPKVHRQGLGARMYEVAIQRAASAEATLACEVNIRPRNDASLAFHDRLGFASVGEQDADGGSKMVTMLVHGSGGSGGKLL